MFSEAHGEWRKHPWLRRTNNVKAMLPGFGTAVVIFGTYVFVDEFYKRLTANQAARAKTAESAETH